MTTAISIENVSKYYRLGAIGGGALSADLNRWWARVRGKADPLLKIGQEDHGNRQGEFIWALRDVSARIAQGEAVGIIGRNGAGKSTLLKILSRVTGPTSGLIRARGRVASLLEVGTGFHQELSGRENIYLNGAILGMTRAEVRRKFDEIVAFAEIEKFLDTPVKRYSSGMYVRLAFAVAAHLEPEILVVDEVLAVGDAAFQKKCLGKMESVAGEGRTILFVSHNMAAIQALCDRAILLETGRLIMEGNVDEAIGCYLQRSQQTMQMVSLAERHDRAGNGQMRFTGVTLLDKSGQPISDGQSGEDLTIALDYTRTPGASDQAVIRLAFAGSYGQRLFMCLSRSSHVGPLRLTSRGQIRCTIPRLPLLEGRYTVSIWCKLNEQMADELQDAFTLSVIPGNFFGTGKTHQDDAGQLLVQHNWEVT
jgi:lipopolysaccharide transport system ATP-binding protein